MRNRITLKQIANEFNVSVSTVSKALNNSPEISSKTKAKIQEYAKSKKYKPNSIALSLKGKSTKTIGVIIPNILNNFFSKVFVGIEEVTSANGYTIISCISNESYDKEVKTIELLNNGLLDGFIISIAEETQIKKKFSHFQQPIDEGVPLVLFDRVTNVIECDKVIVDDLDGAYKATKHLLKTGCQKIAVITYIDNISVGKLRLEGYKKALKEFNLKLDASLIIKINKDEKLERVLEPLLKTNKIDGLLCLEENAALKSHRLLKELNYKIPDDISIICFTNGRLPRYLTPTLTTISQHAKRIGQNAAKMLIKRLESKSEYNYETEVIKTSFVERGSTNKTTD